MASDVDTNLLDRVFQPAADRLCAATTCFGLARVSVGAAATLHLVALVLSLLASDAVTPRCLAGATALLALGGVQAAWALIGRAERQTRPGHLNRRRITLQWQRRAWLVIAAWAAGAALAQPGAASAADVLASLAWVATVYFASCSPREPRPEPFRAVVALGAS